MLSKLKPQTIPPFQFVSYTTNFLRRCSDLQTAPRITKTNCLTMNKSLVGSSVLLLLGALFLKSVNCAYLTRTTHFLEPIYLRMKRISEESYFFETHKCKSKSQDY